jgi:hypothetical protein
LLDHEFSLFLAHVSQGFQCIGAILSVLLVGVPGHSCPSIIDACFQRLPSGQHVIQCFLLRIEDLLSCFVLSIKCLLCSLLLDVELLLFQ